VQRDTCIPLPAGGCLLFHGLLHHGTPTNHSENRRRAVQYHYHPKSVQKTTLEERMKHFGSEGKNVEC
jgi:phytanoyl-CoA hydroxylase